MLSHANPTIRSSTLTTSQHCPFVRKEKGKAETYYATPSRFRTVSTMHPQRSISPLPCTLTPFLHTNPKRHLHHKNGQTLLSLSLFLQRPLSPFFLSSFFFFSLQHTSCNNYPLVLLSLVISFLITLCGILFASHKDLNPLLKG